MKKANVRTCNNLYCATVDPNLVCSTDMKAINGLLQSRKAMLVLAIVITLTVLLVMNKIDKGQYESLLKYIIPVWLGSHAWEEGKRNEGSNVANTFAQTVATMTELSPRTSSEPDLDQQPDGTGKQAADNQS